MGGSRPVPLIILRYSDGRPIVTENGCTWSSYNLLQLLDRKDRY